MSENEREPNEAEVALSKHVENCQVCAGGETRCRVGSTLYQKVLNLQGMDNAAPSE